MIPNGGSAVVLVHGCSGRFLSVVVESSWADSDTQCKSQGRGMLSCRWSGCTCLTPAARRASSTCASSALLTNRPPAVALRSNLWISPQMKRSHSDRYASDLLIPCAQPVCSSQDSTTRPTSGCMCGLHRTLANARSVINATVQVMIPGKISVDGVQPSQPSSLSDADALTDARLTSTPVSYTHLTLPTILLV